MPTSRNMEAVRAAYRAFTDGDLDRFIGALAADFARAAREVGLALPGLDGDVSRDDDHGCAPLPKPSCVKASP